jgi:hypothetical protein
MPRGPVQIPHPGQPMPLTLNLPLLQLPPIALPAN